MRIFWLIVGVLVAASGAMIVLGRAGDDAGRTLLDERAGVTSAPDPGARSAMLADTTEPPRPGSSVTRGMIREPWATSRSGTADHEGHRARPDLMAGPGGGLDSLDAMLGLDEPEEIDPQREAAANKLLKILAVATLTGEGTASDPYVVSWELLDTARHGFRPRDGLTEIPPEVERLDGAVVRLEGYFLAPFSLSDTDQLLLMRYVWDGCCIGVPPTAYSTVEVSLAEPIGRRVLAEHRTLTVQGTLKIDPYESRGWLLGLYVMEDARVVGEE